jgi:hypothetical protein
MKIKHRGRLALGAAVLAVAAVASAEDVLVKYPARLVGGKSPRHAVVAQLNKGDRLQVVAREGPWLRVKIGDKEGYVSENAVNNGGAGDSQIAGVGKQTGASADPLSAGAASKGVGQDAIKWSQSSGKSTAGLERMIAMSTSVTGPDCDSFEAAGNVGPSRK